MRISSLGRSLATILPALVLAAARVHAGGDPVHFVLYATEPHEGAPKFIKFGPVHLADQFGAGDYEVTKATNLGVPADKNGGGILNAETHLREFAIKQTSGTSFEKRSGIRVTNQCNDVLIEVVKPVSLMVPSSKRLVPPAGPVPTASGTNHFLCYQAKAKLPKGMQVDVTDQFQSRRYDLKKLTKLCLPVDKSGTPIQLSGPNKGQPFPITAAAIADTLGHLLCYQAKASSKIVPQNECVPWIPKDKGAKFAVKQEKHTPRLGVLVNSQFGTEEVDTKNEVELCIPSIKSAECGDGFPQFDAGEQCDDGNTTSGDGCSSQCLAEIVSPVSEDLPACLQAPYSDFWTFDVTAGDSVVVRADTTSAPTAADLIVDVSCTGGLLLSGDDQFECTFPPPDFSCPEVAFTAPETGSCVVQVHNFETCASNTAAYALSVTRNAAAARVALRDDDACPESCATFSALGTYAFKVPKDVNSIIVDVFGAQGGMGRIGGSGGLGGRTVSELQVTPGDTLQINVGGRGGDASSNLTDGGAGGFNGGATGGDTTFNGAGGGGGGASDMRIGMTTLVVAGGGGGSGGGTNCCGGVSVGGAGGAGGGLNGSPGATVGGAGGGGATDVMGGAAGGAGADPGIAGFGGMGANGDGAGGGGGGGLYGGGGGAGNVNELGGGGGGGGSGYGPTDSFLSGGQRAGHGLVRIIVD